MGNDDKPPAKPVARPVEAAADEAAARQRAKPSPERPFDLWLQKQLHAMYDEIASEPLPNDLLNLIDRDAAQADGRNDGKAPGGKKP
ncbi:MAG: hypothetical protein ISP45_10085 [Reyranella sp.]|nr:hypothetical protein [Reyranella sp.]